MIANFYFKTELHSANLWSWRWNKYISDRVNSFILDANKSFVLWIKPLLYYTERLQLGEFISYLNNNRWLITK